jgi:hypothetical protein
VNYAYNLQARGKGIFRINLVRPSWSMTIVETADDSPNPDEYSQNGFWLSGMKKDTTLEIEFQKQTTANVGSNHTSRADDVIQLKLGYVKFKDCGNSEKEMDCNFESDVAPFCMWSDNGTDGGEWKRVTSSDVLGSLEQEIMGPSDGSGHFLLLSGSKGSTAILVSKEYYMVDWEPICVLFSYWSFGAQPGELKAISIDLNENTEEVFFHVTTGEEDRWHNAHVQLRRPQRFRLIFQGVVKNDPGLGGIAIDNIR